MSDVPFIQVEVTCASGPVFTLPFLTEDDARQFIMATMRSPLVLTVWVVRPGPKPKGAA